MVWVVVGKRCQSGQTEELSSCLKKNTAFHFFLFSYNQIAEKKSFLGIASQPLVADCVRNVQQKRLAHLKKEIIKYERTCTVLYVMTVKEPSFNRSLVATMDKLDSYFFPVCIPDLEPDYDWALMKLINSFPDCCRVFLEDILNQCNGDYEQASTLLISTLS